MSVDVPPAATPIAAAPTNEAQPTGSAYQWYVLTLLFLISIVNMMDRTIVPALAEPLKAEFHLSDSQFGFLAGLVYAVSYTICGIPIGLLMDRVNRAKMLAFLVSVWGGATMVLGAATSFMGLIATRVVVAGAESGGSSTCVSIITDSFPPNKRATAIGVFYSANGIAAFTAFSVAGWVGATYGWRTAFICAGAPGVILGIVAFLTLREPKRGQYDPPAAQAAPKPKPAGLATIAKELVTNSTIRYLTIASVFSVFGVAGVGAFTASFFYRVHHLSLAHAGVVTGLIMGGAYALGAILGGFASDRATKRSANGGIYVVAASTLLAAPCAVAGFLSPSLIVSVVLIFLFKMLVGAFYGATFAGITRAAPMHVRGAMVTFTSLIMNLCGAGGGPQLAGVLSDAFKAAGYADPLKLSLAAVSMVFVLSALLFFLAARKMRTAVPSA